MKKFQNFKKPALSLLILISGLVLLWFALSPIRATKAKNLGTEAAEVHRQDTRRAMGMLVVANKLHALEENVILLAEWQLEEGDAEGALETLKGFSSQSDNYWFTRAKALIDLNQNDSAQAILLLRQGPEFKELQATTKLPNSVMKARKFYDLYLYQAAERALPEDLNTTGAIILAETRLITGKDLPDTVSKLRQAIANDPSDIRLHELLKQVYEKQGNQKAASEEAAIIQKLKSGRL